MYRLRVRRTPRIPLRFRYASVECRRIHFFTACVFAAVLHHITRDNLELDCLWSSLPVIYLWVFSGAAGPPCECLDAMAVLGTLCTHPPCSHAIQSPRESVGSAQPPAARRVPGFSEATRPSTTSDRVATSAQEGKRQTRATEFLSSPLSRLFVRTAPVATSELFS